MRKALIFETIAVLVLFCLSSCGNRYDEPDYYQWGVISGTEEKHSSPDAENLLYLEIKNKIIEFDNANHGTGMFANDEEALQAIEFDRRSAEFDKLYDEFSERVLIFDNNEHFFEFTNMFALLKSVGGCLIPVKGGNPYLFQKESEASMRLTYNKNTELRILENLITADSTTFELTVPLEECTLVFDDIREIVQAEGKSVRVYNEDTRTAMVFSGLDSIVDIKNISVEDKNLVLAFNVTKEHASRLNLEGNWYAVVPIIVNPGDMDVYFNIKVPFTII